MEYEFKEAYDVLKDRFVKVPADVQQRIESEMRNAPSGGDLARAMSSVLKHLSGGDVGSTHTAEVIHQSGPISQWKERLNETEDALREKQASELAEDLPLPNGLPLSILQKEPGFGSMRAVIYVEWDETQWDAAHAKIAFTAVMTRKRAS